jgi:methionyl-tRNA formyltransferase
MQPKIIILSGKGQYEQFFYNGLYDCCPIANVIIEEDLDYKIILKRRIKKIGYIKVAGQYLFTNYMVKRLMKSAKGRVREIIKQSKLNPSKIPGDKIISVNSVNDQSTIDLIIKINPDIIIVNSTRLLSKKLLRSVKAHFINIHGGITPAYCGMAGAYWALANGEPDKCGSTIHLIDEGVDTGPVLYQDTITVSGDDNYLTYAFLQIPKEIQMLKKAINDILKNEIKPMSVLGPYKLWYEPDIWEYWYNAAVKKVK